jgi:hypothetical protein
MGRKVFKNKIEYRDDSGGLHRLDGPARTYTDTGSKEWWVNGKQHRIDKPAAVYGDGDEAWYHWGKLHRIDGPAITGTTSDGDVYREWWIDNESYSKVDFDNHPEVKLYKRKKIINRVINNKNK